MAENEKYLFKETSVGFNDVIAIFGFGLSQVLTTLTFQRSSNSAYLLTLIGVNLGGAISQFFREVIQRALTVAEAKENHPGDHSVFFEAFGKNLFQALGRQLERIDIRQRVSLGFFVNSDHSSSVYYR